MSSNSVVQSWLAGISLRMQSTLLLSLRGPDTHYCPEIKRVIRWMRGLTFVPANPANVHEFMGPAEIQEIREKTPIFRELEFCTEHYIAHFMHGLEVLAYCHPSDETRDTAFQLFTDICDIFHLEVEGPIAFQRRLGHIEWDQTQPSSYSEVEANTTKDNGK